MLAFTITDFKTKCHVHQEKDISSDKTYVHETFDLFNSCLQGIGANVSDICTVKYKGDTHTET
jgi:hypothetical protein